MINFEVEAVNSAGELYIRVTEAEVRFSIEGSINRIEGEQKERQEEAEKSRAFAFKGILPFFLPGELS